VDIAISLGLDLSYHTDGLVSQPSAALLFLFVLTLFLNSLELLLGQGLAATLCLETATVVAIGGCVYVEEGGHLPLTLVLIVVHLWTDTILLVLAVEAIEAGL
jgi:hypothetical protein